MMEAHKEVLIGRGLQQSNMQSDVPSISVSIFHSNHIYFFYFAWKQLVEQDSEGQCNSECKTIERACQEVIFQEYILLLEFYQLLSCILPLVKTSR